MDIAGPIINPVVESIVSRIKTQLDFITSSTKYVKNMCIKMKELDDTRIDLENRKKQNEGNRLEVPTHVTGWLKEVEDIHVEVENISNKAGSCFSLKTRREVGSKACNKIIEIERLIEENTRITWSDHPSPLARVGSTIPSTSIPPPTDRDEFKSREKTFAQALEALEPNHKSHMVALCGMGGVGKSTMKDKLKDILKEKKTFKFIIEAAIGEKTDLIALQDAIADYLSIDLKEKTKKPRALKLSEWFKANSDGGKNKFLVILDDVWQSVDLNDIGLSPLPNQCVDFKVLLTSRDTDVCTEMGVEANLILKVRVLETPEAQRFFHQTVMSYDNADLDPVLYKIGDDIVRRCQGLPIAIKTIASTLKGKKKHVWEDALSRLKHNDIEEIVHQVFEINYNNLKNEAKSVFLLCGLYPEDFDIPIEELMRYGWGLKLFKQVDTIREARNRSNTCIQKLLDKNLLIKSHRVGCIKMHDLARAFLLGVYSQAGHDSIVNHGVTPEWPANDKRDFCKRISLSCKSVFEFPSDFKFPNLSFLKLVQGDKSVRYPEKFYEEVEKLQVLAFEEMEYPLLPRSPHCSTNLQTLCLHRCPLEFDMSAIENLLNLEVLSFANSNIEKLPSTIQNLKKLRVLDLTGCVNLHIDNGVLENLVNLEELYMRVHEKNSISLTSGNCNEFVSISKNLNALEIEFKEYNDRLCWF